MEGSRFMNCKLYERRPQSLGDIRQPTLPPRLARLAWFRVEAGTSGSEVDLESPDLCSIMKHCERVYATYGKRIRIPGPSRRTLRSLEEWAR